MAAPTSAITGRWGLLGAISMAALLFCGVPPMRRPTLFLLSAIVAASAAVAPSSVQPQQLAPDGPPDDEPGYADEFGPLDWYLALTNQRDVK